MTKHAYTTRPLLRAGAVALVALASLGKAETASACSAEPLIGSVCFTAISYCPNGYLPAAGQTLNIQNYQALASLLGTMYGGDGRTTFGLPDLRGRAPIGSNNQNIVTGGVVISPAPLATLRGQETAALKTANLPPAGSSGGPAQVAATTNAATTNVPSGTVQLAMGNATVAKSNVAANTYAPIGGPQVALGGVSGGGSSTGGNSTPFGIVSPQIALTACIAWNGIWPERPD